MSRIAEFNSADDAWRFRNMKGKDDYEVCGGVHMLYAVTPKTRAQVDAGQFEPFDTGSVRPYNDPDEQHGDER